MSVTGWFNHILNFLLCLFLWRVSQLSFLMLLFFFVFLSDFFFLFSSFLLYIFWFSLSFYLIHLFILTLLFFTFLFRLTDFDFFSLLCYKLLRSNRYQLTLLLFFHRCLAFLFSLFFNPSLLFWLNWSYAFEVWMFRSDWFAGTSFNRRWITLFSGCNSECLFTLSFAKISYVSRLSDLFWSLFLLASAPYYRFIH